MPEFLPELPADAVLAALSRAPGNELSSGRFDSPESTQALSANAIGFFLSRPALLPPLPAVPMGRPETVAIMEELRLPWKGGRHPWLDAVVTTPTSLVGIEVKRYDPFRPGKATAFDAALDSRDWGAGMARIDALRAALVSGAVRYRHLDAVELLRDAYALRTQAVKRGRGAVLVYLHAAPAAWASGKPVDAGAIRAHAAEIADFAARVKGSDVVFAPLRWSDLLAQWAGMPALAAHAAAVTARFGVI